MKQAFEPLQPEKAAGAFDAVDIAEDVVDQARIFGRLLQRDEIAFENSEMLVGLGDEFAQ